MAAFALVTPSQAELRLRRLVGSGCEPGGDGLRGTRYLPKARLLRAGGRYLPGCPWAALGAPCLHGVLLPDLLPSFPSPLSSLPLAWKGPGPAGTSAERDRFCTHPGLARVSPAWQQGPGFGVSGGGGGLSPSRPVSLPRRRPLATSPPSVTQRLPVHQPHRRSCRGVPAQRAVPEGPDPVLASHAQTFLPRPQEPTAAYHFGRAPRSKGQRSGQGVLAGRIQLPPPSPAFCSGSAPPPAPEPEPFPTYCFISGPADKYSSIPRGGREVPNNGPASRWPRCAVCTPPGAGGAASIPPAAEPGRGPPSRGELHPFSSLGGPD